jgi:hypothetical protein
MSKEGEDRAEAKTNKQEREIKRRQANNCTYIYRSNISKLNTFMIFSKN